MLVLKVPPLKSIDLKQSERLLIFMPYDVKELSNQLLETPALHQLIVLKSETTELLELERIHFVIAFL